MDRALFESEPVVRFSEPPAPERLRATSLLTPIGTIRLLEDGHLLAALRLPASRPASNGVPRQDTAGTRRSVATRQLEEYFAGERIEFDLDLAPSGTPFQLRVWAALCTIPYGGTVSYGAIARRIGNPRASRAVGTANNRNPIALVIPCHRVIGADGSLTGYGGGLDTKEYLLELEARPR